MIRRNGGFLRLTALIAASMGGLGVVGGCQSLNTRATPVEVEIAEESAGIDIRLAQRLLKLAGPGGHVAQTHQQLASELGTAREVVSRQLQEFQRRGWVEVARGDVALTNRDALGRLAADAGSVT